MHLPYRCIAGLLAAALSIAAARSGPGPPPSRPVWLQPVSSHHPPLCRRFPYHIAPARDRKLTHLQGVVAAFARALPPSRDPIERGAIIYLQANGSLRTGDFSEGDFESVTLTATPQAHEVIIAAAHTHAPGHYYAADQRRLSREDIELGKQLLSHPRTSPRLLLYVIDVASGTISEYPASGRCHG